MLEVGTNGCYAVNSKIITHDQLAQELHDIFDPRPDKIIFISGNPKVKVQDVIDAMDIARGAGVKVIGVPPKDAPGQGTPGTCKD